MDTTPRSAVRDAAAAEAGRRDRLAWESEGIEKADADIAAGRVVGASAVRTWIESIGTENKLPVPTSGR